MANNPVFSVRSDQETIEKFTSIAEKSGMKKSEVLPALIAVWESEEVKQKLPGRAEEIDAFDELLKQTRTAYHSSLQLAMLAKETGQKEAAVEMEMKSRTIRDLQKKQDEQEAVLKAKEDKIQTLTKEIERLTADVERLNESIAEKNANIKTLQANVDAANLLGLVKDVRELFPKIESVAEKEDAEIKM